MTAFHLDYLRWYPGSTLGDSLFRTDQASVDVANKSGRTRIPRLAPLDWIIRCDARGYARTFSKKFSTSESAPRPARIEIVMGHGGSMSGTITDPSMRPIKGVHVMTHDTTYRDNARFWTLLPPPEQRTSPASGLTDALGRFKLSTLAPGSYQLQLDHPMFVRQFASPFVVKEGVEIRIPRLVMQAGCQVRGVVTEDGVPSPGSRVVISRLAEREDPDGYRVSDWVYANKKGIYESSRPLPPGRYEFTITPRLRDTDNPLKPILYAKERQQIHRLTLGKPHRIDLDIPKR